MKYTNPSGSRIIACIAALGLSFAALSSTQAQETELLDTANNKGQIIVFNGPDDLHLDPAAVVIAVDVFGDDDLEVNGVTFLGDKPGGGEVEAGDVTVTTDAVNQIDAWSATTIFEGADDDSVRNLEIVMESIRWTGAPDPVSVEISGLTPGVAYEIQLLTNEGRGPQRFRVWDIAINDELVADNISSIGHFPDGEWDDTNSAGYVGEFVAPGDGTFSIEMAQDIGGEGPVGVDNNPILNAIVVHTAGPVLDTDEDGMPDGYEERNGLDPNVNDAALDKDGDGLTNFKEFELRTNPQSKDTDGDGAEDNVETNTGTWVDQNNRGTDPLNTDSDEDDLSDGVETNTGTFVDATNTGTDPNKKDSDADTFPDGVEISLGSDPTDAESDPGGAITLPLAYWDFERIDDSTVPDESGNGNDGEIEGTIDTAPGPPTGPTPTFAGAFSLDGASFFNVPGLEVDQWVSDDGDYSLAAWIKPDEESLSGDRFIFGQTAQGIHNGLRGSGTLHTAHWGADNNAGTPLDADEWIHAVWTYNGEDDVANIYLNGENDLEDWGQRAPNGSGNIIVGGRNGGTQNFVGHLDDVAIWDVVLRPDEIISLANGASPINRTQDDTDGDGMPDSYETAFGLDPNVDDKDGDKDGDGLTNFQEFELFTDPSKADTDGDGINDKIETNTGTWVDATDTGTDPRKADTDRDGLDDGVETNSGTFVDASNPGTSPVNPDTDGDQFEDGREISLGTNPLDKTSFPLEAIELDELVGMDLTDPEDDGDPEDDTDYNAVFLSSEEEGFGGGEFAFNVFDNVVGGGNDKWCCGTDSSEPLWVQATFESPIVLELFTVSSANDTPGRDPRVWEIQGSNDPDAEIEDFTTIFRQDDPAESVWGTTRGLTLQWDAGTHFAKPSGFTTLRFISFETGLTSGAFFQVSEIEFFGSEGTGAPFQIDTIVRDGNKVTLTWPSGANDSFAIERAANLGTWEELTDGHPSGGEATSFEVTLPDPAPAEIYYRVRKE